MPIKAPKGLKEYEDYVVFETEYGNQVELGRHLSNVQLSREDKDNKRIITIKGFDLDTT